MTCNSGVLEGWVVIICFVQYASKCLYVIFFYYFFPLECMTFFILSKSYSCKLFVLVFIMFVNLYARKICTSYILLYSFMLRFYLSPNHILLSVFIISTYYVCHRLIHKVKCVRYYFFLYSFISHCFLSPNHILISLFLIPLYYACHRLTYQGNLCFYFSLLIHITIFLISRPYSFKLMYYSYPIQVSIMFVISTYTWEIFTSHLFFILSYQFFLSPNHIHFNSNIIIHYADPLFAYQVNVHLLLCIYSFIGRYSFFFSKSSSFNLIISIH